MGVVPQHVPQLAAMLPTYYAFWLLWKYRKDEPTLSVFLIFLLSYVPVWTYLGWHYTLAGWMIRAALLWPMVAKLAVRDLRGWAPETLRARLRRSRCLLVAPVHP